MTRTEKFIADFPIARLSPGHTHPFAAANPRKSGHETDIAGLAHSIHEQGVLQPLRVFPKEDGSGEAWVYIGERRLLASQMNLDAHPNARGTVPVLWVEGITAPEAFRESLVEQLNRLPLHAIEQHEAFAECARQGMSEGEIADYYTVPKQIVRQRLALGDIAPEIRLAWREGEIDETCAREFCRLKSHKDQLSAFKRLKKSHGLYPEAVRASLVPDQGAGARLVNFVGLDAFRERGGEIYEDLFNGIHGVSDIALARLMADEKLDGKVLELTSLEGWKWAKRVDEMPASWRVYDRVAAKSDLTVAEKDRLAAIRQQLQTEELDDDTHGALAAEQERIQQAADMRAFSARQKAKSGCVLMVSALGDLVIEAGVILPAIVEKEAEEKPAAKPDAAATAGGDADQAEEPKPRLSNGQASDLAVTLTEAGALAVSGNFTLAMSVALAALAINSDGLPARLRHGGMGMNTLKLSSQDSFAANLKFFLKLKPQQRESLFAQAVAASLRFDSSSAERHAMTDADVAALVNAVDPKVMVAMIQKRFDPEAYFNKAPKALALAAIEDVFGKKEAQFSAATGKPELVGYALENCAPAKWLPEELRPEGYSGPGAKKKSTTKAPGRKRRRRKGSGHEHRAQQHKILPG